MAKQCEHNEQINNNDKQQNKQSKSDNKQQ